MQPDTPVPSSLPEGRFEGREAFRQLVRDAFARAAEEGWKDILVCDASFADWPLGERAVAESLQAWSKTGRRFVMMARRYDEVTTSHARFVTWRRAWSHIVECWGCSSADPQEFPSALCGPAWVARRLDLERSTGVSGSEPQRRILLREELAEWQRKSSSAFPASTLGL